MAEDKGLRCLISTAVKIDPYGSYSWIDLLKNSMTNFENEEELSLSNFTGESYSTTLPILIKKLAEI